MADEPNVDIVKMDATINDVPKPFEVIGFPSIYWLPSNDKDSPGKYEGKQQFDHFIACIARFATQQLISYNRNGEPSHSKPKL